MNLWPLAKHAEILFLRIITELNSLQGEEEIAGANFFCQALARELRTSWVSRLIRSLSFLYVPANPSVNGFSNREGTYPSREFDPTAEGKRDKDS